jgi:hypothetical protein
VSNDEKPNEATIFQENDLTLDELVDLIVSNQPKNTSNRVLWDLISCYYDFDAKLEESLAKSSNNITFNKIESLMSDLIGKRRSLDKDKIVDSLNKIDAEAVIGQKKTIS